MMLNNSDIKRCDDLTRYQESQRAMYNALGLFFGILFLLFLGLALSEMMNELAKFGG